ncbi:MAG: heme-binding domain-containing protein [Acidimicrobiales bacterium]|nr:heme-binding domain-containing protein [Acidimicrobiales bacterium]
MNRFLLALGALGLVFGLVFGLLMGFVPIVAVALLVWLVAIAVDRLRRRRSPASSSGVGAAVGAYAAAFVVVMLLIQLVPYGRAHANPETTGEPQWANARTRELMVNACYGCHSNEVEYPWYANIAPISWGVQHHVEEGRGAVNYSEFGTSRGHWDETIEVILEGEMPPAYYTRFGLHPEADLTDAEIEELIAGLRATPGLGEHEDHDDHEDHEDDQDHEDDEDDD